MNGAKRNIESSSVSKQVVWAVDGKIYIYTYKKTYLLLDEPASKKERESEIY